MGEKRTALNTHCPAIVPFLPETSLYLPSVTDLPLGKGEAKAPGTGAPAVGGRWQQGGSPHHGAWFWPAHLPLPLYRSKMEPAIVWREREQCKGVGNAQRGGLPLPLSLGRLFAGFTTDCPIRILILIAIPTLQVIATCSVVFNVQWHVTKFNCTPSQLLL